MLLLQQYFQYCCRKLTNLLLLVHKYNILLLLVLETTYCPFPHCTTSLDIKFLTNIFPFLYLYLFQTYNLHHNSFNSTCCSPALLRKVHCFYYKLNSLCWIFSKIPSLFYILKIMRVSDKVNNVATFWDFKKKCLQILLSNLKIVAHGSLNEKVDAVLRANLKDRNSEGKKIFVT